MSTPPPHAPEETTPNGTRQLFDRLENIASADGAGAMLEALAMEMAAAKRWHALFDVRLIQARLALGLPLSGDLGPLAPDVREELDAKSLDACREVGWPLLDEGQPSAAWMYLRASATPSDVAVRLAALAAREDLADREGTRSEVMQLALWEGIDPALGIGLVLDDHGTCNAITAYNQAVARLPAARRRPAADRIVDHLHAECLDRLRNDLADRGIALGESGSITTLLESADRAGIGLGIHVDVSHLHNMLEIARECVDPERIQKARELATYAKRIPDDLLMPGQPPFENLATASHLFFDAELGQGTDEAVAFFSRQAKDASDEAAASEWLAVLLWRIGRPREAVHAMLDRPATAADAPGTGLLPGLVEMAVTAGAVPELLEACRTRGDPVTFAAALAAHHHLHQRSASGPFHQR